MKNLKSKFLEFVLVNKTPIIAVLVVILAGGLYYYHYLYQPVENTKVTVVVPPPRENVDVERDITPVNRLTENQYALLDSLNTMDSKKVGPFLNKYWPDLRKNTKGYIMAHYTGDSVLRINFFYGKLDSTTAKDSAGTDHTGHFDGLCAEVYFASTPKTAKYFAMRCMNGMCFPLDSNGKPQSLSYIKVFDVNFTIDHGGDCLMNHMDFKQALKFGKKNNLPVYHVINTSKRERINYKEAATYTNENEVYIPVTLGDRGNRITCVYHRARKH